MDLESRIRNPRCFPEVEQRGVRVPKWSKPMGGGPGGRVPSKWVGVPKNGQGSVLVKKCKKIKVLRMEFSIVANLDVLQENIFSLVRSPQLNYRRKSRI